jgi:hypothetical protein
MKTYHTNDGETFTALNAREAVRKLRALSRAPEPTVQEFMEAVAERVLTTTGIPVATDTPTHFIYGLLQSGLFTEGQE